MTVRVRVRLAGHVRGEEIASSGSSLDRAVESAAVKLAGSGKTLHKKRIDTHTWRWVWGWRPGDRVVLSVRESRSGPSGKTTKPQICASISKQALVDLDALAKKLNLTRSGTIEWMIGLCRGTKS